jgi:hypothetical protein
VRATERDLWWSMIWHRRLHRDRIDRLRSASFLAPESLRTTRGRAQSPAEHRHEQALTRLVSQRHVPWKVPYNLACHYSLNGASEDRWEKVFAMLERARLGRGAHQLTREWLSRDPDLAAVRTAEAERFDAFARRVPGPSLAEDHVPASRALPVRVGHWDGVA